MTKKMVIKFPVEKAQASARKETGTVKVNTTLKVIQYNFKACTALK